MSTFRQLGIAIEGPVKITVEYQNVAWWPDIETQEEVFLFTRDDVTSMVRLPIGSNDSRILYEHLYMMQYIPTKEAHK